MENEIEIDLLELLRHLKKKFWVIVAACGVCALAALIASQLFMTPKYTASTRVYVLNRSNENTVVYSDLQLSSQLLNDYKVLITGQNVTREVIKELGLNMSANQLSGKIGVTAPDNTRVLQISVTDTEPQRAADIANAVREVAALQIKQIMDVDSVNIIYEADVPAQPSSPNVKRNVILGAVLGIFGSILILAVVYIRDDTIRTEEDVEQYLGLSTLGVIPNSACLIGNDKLSQQKKKKNSIVSR